MLALGYGREINWTLVFRYPNIRTIVLQMDFIHYLIKTLKPTALSNGRNGYIFPFFLMTDA
jgi:hypothetical protein